jgi:hypothetical protein
MKTKETQIQWKRSGATPAAILLLITCAGLGFLGANSLPLRQGGHFAMAICPGLVAESRNASDLISQDIRNASSADSPSANQLVLKRFNEKVSYTFNAAQRTLIRADSLKSEKLLTGIDSFSISLLRPAPDKTIGKLISATNDKARALACGWSCSRKIAGLTIDSEETHMAAILLRNR